MTKLVNRAKVKTSTNGTGTITLGSAIPGYQSFASAGVLNSDVVRYAIEQDAEWEIGTGTYSSAGNTLTRTVTESSNAGAPINLAGNADVYVTAAADDLLQPQDIGITVQGYSAALQGTTASYTTALNSKLNGIEAGATADQTAAEILTAIKTVDGTGTGLDADLLDGQHGTYYTGYTDTAIANLVATAPATLDTLNELAAALGNDPNFATTVTTSIGTKAASAITISAGAGTTGGGNLTANRTIAHADTSTQPSLTALTGANVISDIDVDTYGHVTAMATRTMTAADLGALTGNQTITLSGDLTGSGTTAINAQIAANVVGANELNVSGNGTTAQYLRSDGDGTFTWATPTDTNTTYTASHGLSLVGTDIRYTGYEIPSGANLNTYRTTGYYTQNANVDAVAGTNYPVALAGILQVITDDYGDGLFTTQLYSQYNTSNYFIRNYYNGTWSAWRDLTQDTNTTYSVGNGGLTEINFTSALNSKLAGIEAGATADQTAAEILTAIKTVDGAGSGLDADLLDGLNSASFMRSDVDDSFSGNLTSGNSNWIKFYNPQETDTNDGKIGSGVFGTGLNIVGAQTVAGTGRQIRLWGSVYTDSGYAFWHSGNDGAGSGLDADLLDGLQATQFVRSDVADVITGPLTTAADTHITFGPNSTWNSNLRVGGNGRTVNSVSDASVVTTNGNLHLDAGNDKATYLNYYAGTSGIMFGSGSSSIVAVMGPDGDLWKGASDNTGSKYWHGGNDGTGSGLDADLLDGQQGSYYQPASTAITTSNIGSQSVNYAATAGRAYPRRSDGGELNFYWAGQGGQPAWLWGGNDATNMYVYNPSNFSVSYATTSGSTTGNAATATTLQTARTIALAGDVTGSVSFNGSANATITAVVVDDSHNHIIANVDGLQAALDSKGAVNDIFYTNAQVVTTSYTLGTGRNAMTAGPVTINSGITVTIPSGTRWVVV